MVGFPDIKFLKDSLFMERKEINTCRNMSMVMAIIPFIREASAESIGIAASSAIMNTITS